MNKDLFEKVINTMQNENLNMKSLIVTQNDKEYKHLFEEEQMTNLRSLSKPITSLALGIAISKGYFKDGVETYIMPYFNEINITNDDNLNYLKEIKIKHLITLTFGYDEQILNEKHIETLPADTNLVEFALNYPIKYKPGTTFCYCNAPIYLLSVLIEKEVGMKLSEFVKLEIMDKLHIKSFNWLECNQNHSMGCTGIEMLPSDLHKLAKLFLSNGNYNGEQIIPIEWLKEMTIYQVPTPDNYDESRALPKYGYGYNLWICKNGIYYHDGSDGQYIIIVPDKNMVITTTAKQTSMTPITNCMREVFKPDIDLIKKLVDIHLGSQLKLYMSEKQECEKFDNYFGDLIDDTYWNFATNIKANTKDEFISDWEEIKDIFINKKRQPVAYFTPISPLYAERENLGLDILYTDSWLILNNISNYPYYKSNLDLTLEKVDRNNIDDFIQAVCDGFSSDDPNDPYGGLSDGYKVALKNSISADDSKYKIQNYIARYNGTVIGTATANYDSEIACVYNVTTNKEYKRNGIAKEIMAFLIQDMASKNIKIICLQTEKGFYTEEVYLKLGFKKVFDGVALGKE